MLDHEFQRRYRLLCFLLGETKLQKEQMKDVGSWFLLWSMYERQRLIELALEWIKIDRRCHARIGLDQQTLEWIKIDRRCHAR